MSSELILIVLQYLHSIVTVVSHEQCTISCHDNILWLVKLPGLFPEFQN